MRYPVGVPTAALGHGGGSIPAGTAAPIGRFRTLA